MLDTQSRSDIATDRILADPDFQTLIRERTRFGWTMSLIMLAVYLVFLGLAAYGKGIMAATVGDSSISWGILFGFCTIVFAFAITGLYVARANGRFDELTARIRKGDR